MSMDCCLPQRLLVRFDMEENGKSARGKDDEIQELIERCKDMQTELEELKKRMLEIQRQVEAELKRRKQNPD